jgi:hypothetical protein
MYGCGGSATSTSSAPVETATCGTPRQSYCVQTYCRPEISHAKDTLGSMSADPRSSLSLPPTSTTKSHQLGFLYYCVCVCKYDTDTNLSGSAKWSRKWQRWRIEGISSVWGGGLLLGVRPFIVSRVKNISRMHRGCCMTLLFFWMILLPRYGIYWCALIYHYNIASHPSLYYIYVSI